jgi:hypothetical protein
LSFFCFETLLFLALLQHPTYQHSKIDHVWRATDRATGSTRYFCGFCLYTARRGDKVVDHVRAQDTKEKPFVCLVCSAAFTRSDGPKEHLSTRKHKLNVTLYHTNNEFAAGAMWLN